MNPSGGRRTDAEHVAGLIHAFYSSATIFAAAELGVFGELAHLRGSDAAGLAKALDLNLRSTTLLLDACAALGILEKDGAVYRNSFEAETYLVPGRPFEISALVRQNREYYPLWLDLPRFVRTGVPVRERPPNGDAETLTGELVRTHTQRLTTGRPIIRRLDLEDRRTLLEVCGGPGTYSVLSTLEYPQLHCIVLDRPDVVKVAAALIAQQGASAHVTTLAADYRSAPFPPGNDVVLLFGILHREDAPRELLQKAADSLNPGGIVYVMDTMTDQSRTRPLLSALLALNLALTSSEGRVYSHVELQNWMQEVGLTDFSAEMLPPPGPEWLAHGRKRQ